MSILSFLALMLLGNAFMSFMFYLNHRFVFHGPIGRILPSWRKIHSDHHAEFFKEGGNKMGKMPIWGALFFIAFHVPIMMFNLPFGIGSLAFVGMYEIYHRLVHVDSPRTSKRISNHIVHHRVPNKNYAAIWNWDRILLTELKVKSE